MKTLDELFDDGWASFHDVVFEVNGQSLNKEELKTIFQTLPIHTQATAFEWGLSDTPFRDNAFVYLKGLTNGNRNKS